MTENQCNMDAEDAIVDDLREQMADNADNKF